MFANYYESKFAWRLTFSLDLFSCCLNSSAQRRLPDFTASTRLYDKFKMPPPPKKKKKKQQQQQTNKQQNKTTNKQTNNKTKQQQKTHNNIFKIK